MKYNGIELEEMTPKKWDGQSREMIIWTDSTDPIHYRNVCYIKTVVGYNPRKCAWVVDDKALVYWPHCAEIPKEESIEDLKEQVKRIKADNKNLCNLFNDKSAEYEKLLEENKSLKEENMKLETEVRFCHKYDELVFGKEPEKKYRRMTHRELANWCANGNGEWTNASMRTAYQRFDYDIDREAEEVSEHIKIRGFDETEWHEPLIED